MSELVAICFNGRDTAEKVLAELAEMQKEYLVELNDTCIVTRDQTGKLKLHQLVNTVAGGALSGATWGGLWGVLIGLLFMNPLIGWALGAAAGAAGGALSGKLADFGINDDFIKQVGATVSEDCSALFVLFKKVTLDRVLQLIYLNSVASRNGNSRRADINRLDIQPKFNVALPDDWFATAYASENIQIDYGDDGKIFFPFDLMVGKKMFEKFVASLEYSRELIHDKDFEPYEWQLEARVGYYF